MGEVTKIAWTDRTFNPWIGCTKVSAGCAHCYAEKYDARFGGGHWGPGKPRRRTSEAYWKQPRRWNEQAFRALQQHSEECACDPTYGMHVKPPHRPRVFCASLADWLDDEVPLDWFVDLLELVRDCTYLDWQLLTKRPENWQRRLLAASGRALAIGKQDLSAWMLAWFDESSTPRNVWVGTSIENQAWADGRIPSLLEIPAIVRFLSMEPLLGPVDLQSACGGAAVSMRLDWVIIGGESGIDARPCDIHWVRDLVGQCRAASVAVFVKQLGAVPVMVERDWRALPAAPLLSAANARRVPWGMVPLKFSDPKGGDPAEWPEPLRIREFPTPAHADS
jgi:protein gp37